MSLSLCLCVCICVLVFVFVSSCWTNRGSGTSVCVFVFASLSFSLCLRVCICPAVQTEALVQVGKCIFVIISSRQLVKQMSCQTDKSLCRGGGVQNLLDFVLGRCYVCVETLLAFCCFFHILLFSSKNKSGNSGKWWPAAFGRSGSSRFPKTWSNLYILYINSYHYINIYIYSFLSYIVWHNWDLTKAALCHFFAIIIQSIPHNMTTLTIWWQLSIPHNMTTLTIRWQLSIPSKGLKKTWYDNKPE